MKNSFATKHLTTCKVSPTRKYPDVAEQEALTETFSQNID